MYQILQKFDVHWHGSGSSIAMVYHLRRASHLLCDWKSCLRCYMKDRYIVSATNTDISSRPPIQIYRPGHQYRYMVSTPNTDISSRPPIQIYRLHHQYRDIISTTNTDISYRPSMQIYRLNHQYRCIVSTTNTDISSRPIQIYRLDHQTRTGQWNTYNPIYCMKANGEN